MTSRTHTNPTKNVVLLRTPAEEGLDNFEDAFNTHGYLAISVPVLETIFVNVGDLSSKIAAGPQSQSLSGVIVTSKRGLEAWSNAVKSIVSADPGLDPGDSGECLSRGLLVAVIVIGIISSGLVVCPILCYWKGHGISCSGAKGCIALSSRPRRY